eukprot:TRINITY_DN55373_c0_g1_i1.p1 TRINITY_DN55373_c0_g1~~TRINITY_DN55373_c0_g1_i1.p1  ORF type:complete len:1194 (+),score=196.59 TRINITY_DN55373_c0_g1_i1:101-3583(+)
MPEEAALQTASVAGGHAADLALRQKLSESTEGVGRGGRMLQAGGGPAGRAPLVRLMRAKQPEIRRAVYAWLDRLGIDPPAATAEIVSLMLVVSDVSSLAVVERDDVLDREPSDVVQDLAASIAVVAQEKGADFSQHWLLSRERGAQRLRENYCSFWRELAAGAPCQTLLNGLASLMRDWLLALADCQFRSIRHVAVVAGLHFVEGLGMQCRALREFCGTASGQLRDSGDHNAGARLSSLTKELEHTQRCTEDLTVARDRLGVAILSRRTKDVAAEIRRSCLEAMQRWARADAESFADPRWTCYLQFGLADRDAEARAASLGALHELLVGNPSSTPEAVRNLAEHIYARVLARCHDIDPGVGAAAVRCASALAARGLLPEEEFDPIIDLVWAPHGKRRGEAAAFVSRFVFSEDVLDYRSGPTLSVPLPTSSSNVLVSRRRLHMLLQFLAEYAEGQYILADRLAAALWRRSSCLEDWEAFAGLALPGSEHALAGEVHVALMHMMEACARLAADEIAAATKPEAATYASAILDRAARALAPRLPLLLATSQAEPAAMRRVASLCRYLLRHCVIQQGAGRNACSGLISAPTADALIDSLKAAFLRQPDPEALEHIAEAMAYLLELASGVKRSVKDLAEGLRSRFLELAPRLGNAEADGSIAADVTTAETAAVAQPEKSTALLAVTTRLRILAKAFDVSLCDLRTFGAAVLGMLDDRAAAADAAVAEGHASLTSAVPGAQLAVTLLELLTLVLVRHTASVLQPAPLLGCVVHDPIDEKELALLPTAMNDLSSVTAALMQSDPNPLVRSAALVSGHALLSAWWNGTRFADLSGAAAKPWTFSLTEELASALWAHLGHLLIEANAVPPDSGLMGSLPEMGNPLQPAAFSQIYALLNSALDPRGGSGDDASSNITDSERVRIAGLACTVVASCRHPEVMEGSLPALVLSQALSPREDLQAVAWALMRRLRKEAHWHPDNAEAFFMVLLRAVQAVNQDAGAGVARDLSFRMLQHVGVGKLSPGLQSGIIVALRVGVEVALSEETKSTGLLEALTPWVTKHVIEDATIRELAAWAQQFGGDGTDEAQRNRAEQAGLFVFIEACDATAARGEATAVSGVPGAGEPQTPTALTPTPMARGGSGGETPCDDLTSPAGPENGGSVQGAKRRRQK